MMACLGHETYVKHFLHGSSLGQVCLRPRTEFALRTHIVMDPAQTKDAATMLTSMAKAGAASLPSCALAKSKSSDTNVEYGALPKSTGKTSFPGKLRDSGALKFLANRTAVRRQARTSSKSPNRVTPTMADECGETSSALREGTPSIV